MCRFSDDDRLVAMAPTTTVELEELVSMRRVLLFLLVLFCINHVAADDIYVSTPVTYTTINTAIASASPGDTVIVPDGEYYNVSDKNGHAVEIDVSGTDGNEITFRPETLGGVTFYGTTRWEIDGSHWIINGFKFEDVRSYSPLTIVIGSMMAIAGDNVRVTNCSFHNIGQQGDAYYGSCIRHNTGADDGEIDHNTFIDWYSIKPITPTDALNLHIHHNYFSDDQIESDGFSAMQIGGDSIQYQTTDTNDIIEYNYFHACNGDREVISLKSSSVTIRYNVFNSSDHPGNMGAMVLRLGDDNVIESNYFFDMGFSSLGFGIRIHGENHTIKNNYIESSESGATSILVAAGKHTTPQTQGHVRAKNITLVNNMIVDSATEGIVSGIWWPTENNPYKPEDLLFKNNIINQSTGTLVKDHGCNGSFDWESNLHYNNGAATYWTYYSPGIPEPSGITHGDPNLTTGYGIQRLQASSTNAIEQGTPDSNVSDDIDGHTRDVSTPDIGCDEYSASAPIRLPITLDEVGYNWDEEESTYEYDASNYSYYKTIAINQTMVNQSIDTGYFPLLVSITDSDLVDHAQADGDDIVFTNSTGIGLLPYEIESWNSTSGELVAWVNLTDIKNVSAIRMYYNDSDGENLENAEGVWDSNYKMVQHLNEDPGPGGSGDIVDSTSNNNDGTTDATMTADDLVTGIIGDGFDFDGADDYVDCGTNSLSITDSATFAGWVKYDADVTGRIMSKHYTSGNYGWLVSRDLTDDSIEFAVSTDGSNWYDAVGGTNAILPDVWYYVVTTYDGSYMRAYLNGSEHTGGDFPYSRSGNIYSSAGSTQIARDGFQGDTYVMSGLLDEIRISNVDRSLAYIETDYNQTASPDLFISGGSEQSNAPDTQFEYYDGESWTEGPAYYYLWFTCYWYTPECANAEQGDSQATLKITNNGSLAGTPKMKLNESAPAGIEIYVDDDNTFSGAVQLNDSYQAVSTELEIDTNVTLWAWANLSGADDWEFETYATVE